jgi:hypothetical protein
MQQLKCQNFLHTHINLINKKNKIKIQTLLRNLFNNYIISEVLLQK